MLMAKAKLTSKGQITIPAEIRAALGVKVGDFLAFETKGDYVAMSAVRSIADVVDDLERRLPATSVDPMSDREALQAHFGAVDSADFYGDGCVGVVRIEPRHPGDTVADRLDSARAKRATRHAG
jgi:AbrB family looped-hinge helix DNA binding protein